LVENGKVIGVETSKGDKIKTNHVVCNASPTLTYNKLIHPKSEVPEIAYKEINARRHGVSTFVVYSGFTSSHTPGRKAVVIEIIHVPGGEQSGIALFKQIVA